MEYCEKIVDFTICTLNDMQVQISSKSFSLRQFMTPGYLAPVTVVVVDNQPNHQMCILLGFYIFLL